MEVRTSANNNNRFLTVPNMLSCLRIALVPVFVYFYRVRHAYVPCLVVLIVSCLSDALDGYIARRFNQITDWGKVIDPIADKLTQFALAFCLAEKNRLLWVLLALQLVKEIVTAVPRLVIMRKKHLVLPSSLHGKITTALLDGTMLLHVFWPGIPSALSSGLIIACMITILVSMILYGAENIKTLRTAKHPLEREV